MKHFDNWVMTFLKWQKKMCTWCSFFGFRCPSFPIFFFFGVSPYSYLILIVLLCIFVLADSKCLNLMQSPQQRTRTPFTLWVMFPLTVVCTSWMDFEKDLLIWVRGKMSFSFFVFTPFISRSARAFCAQLNVIFVCHAPLNLSLSSSYSVCIKNLHYYLFLPHLFHQVHVIRMTGSAQSARWSRRGYKSKYFVTSSLWF